MMTIDQIIEKYSEFAQAGQELEGDYISEQPSDTFSYCRGLLRKSTDSLKATVLLHKEEFHSLALANIRSLIEAFAHSYQMSQDSEYIEQIKADSLRNFSKWHGDTGDDAKAKEYRQAADRITEDDPPSIAAILESKNLGLSPDCPRLVYVNYRKLCEKLHHDFYGTIAYPNVSNSSDPEANAREYMTFLSLGLWKYGSITSLIHNPPEIGYRSEDSVNKAKSLCEEGCKIFQEIASNK